MSGFGRKCSCNKLPKLTTANCDTAGGAVKRGSPYHSLGKKELMLEELVYSKYSRPQKLSDPYSDFTVEMLEDLLKKNDSEFERSDYYCLFGPHLPAGTYEEVMYFLPNAFAYMKMHEDDALDLVTPIFGFCSLNIGRLQKDGLEEIVKDKIMECLNYWVRDFRIEHFDREMCVSKGCSNKDDLMKHLFKIQKVLRLYSLKDFNEFIRITDYKIKSLKDKSDLREAIGNLSNVEAHTIGEVIELAHTNGLVIKDDKLAYFAARKKYIYDQVASISYSEFQNLFEYIEGYTPFSTQHRTKGREYNCVLVLLDNGNWNSYNFDYFFSGQGKDTVIDRTGKIIYVCCTRARENLALFYFSPSTEVLKVAMDWFGKDNVIDLDAVQQNGKH